ncbi:MAG: hypothetical protein ACR2KZ_03890 [Segetibacter sp.]
MADKIGGIDPNVTNPTDPGQDQAPVDPSNTSSIGQKVEQGVIDIKAGISEQSSEWEDEQERSVDKSLFVDRSENYIKDPSPEENNTNSEET